MNPSNGVFAKDGNPLFSGAFGCLERIDLLLGGLVFIGLDMGGQIAWSQFPFQGWFGAGTAVPAGFHFGGSAAAIALLDDFTAYAAVITASFGGHECTIGSFSYCFTNQGDTSYKYDVKKARRGLLAFSLAKHLNV